MNIFIEFFNKALYQPLFNALVWLYHSLPGNDFGVAVIALTLLIRTALHPLMSQSLKSQKILSELQPKMAEIQKKFKDNQQKQAEELIKIYQEQKINPFSGFLPLLVQLPLLIALYQVFWRGLQPGAMDSLYSFVSNSGTINPSFLGLINLSQTSIILAVVAGITQYFQAKAMSPQANKSGNKQASQVAGMMQKQMLYFMPVLTIIILMRLPSAIALYWIVTSLFSIGQQYAINREYVRPE